MIEKPVDKPVQHPIEIVHPSDLHAGVPAASQAPPKWIGTALKWTPPVAILVFVALIAIPGLLKQWLWMDQVNYAGIFWTIL